MRGFGREVGYDGLRDACRTRMDGTSISVLADLFVRAGFDAAELVVPADHLRLLSDKLLPVIAITLLPGDLLHFVVIWRRIGNWFVVMDPAIGRRWVHWNELERELFRHEMPVDPEAWSQYAHTDDFTEPLRRRLSELRVGSDEATDRIEAALADPSWRSIATLDARVRAARSRIDLDAGIPDDNAWMVRPAPGETEDDPQLVTMAGAVVLSVRGFGDQPPDEDLARAIEHALPSTRSLLASITTRGNHTLGWLAMVGAMATGAAIPLIALLAQRRVESGEGLGFLAWMLLAFVLLGAVGAIGALRYGRTLEIALRQRLTARLHALPDFFFRTRPSADLAERAHMLHRVAELPAQWAEAGGALVRALVSVCLIILVVPRWWWLALLVGLVSILVPWLFRPWLVETEHRVRTLAGAQSHSYLDTLIGLLVVRAHRAGPAVEAEHAGLLRAWVRARRDSNRAAAGSLLVVLVVGFAAGLPLVALTMAEAGPITRTLLVAVLVLLIVEAGDGLITALRRMSVAWAIAGRLVEPLVATTPAPPDESIPPGNGPVGVTLQGVGASVDGTALLEGINLDIQPGEHVAVVGASGAGKSTLVSVLLGWLAPDAGQVLVDGRPLTDSEAVRLRRDTVWVDPELAIWGGSLRNNLAPDVEAGTIRAAGLESLVERIGGLDASVGEGGRLLSGGEAQRVRLARAFGCPEPRLVILDEAFRGLDPELRQSLMAECRYRWRGATLVWITHDLDEAAHWDRVVVVADGGVVADGNPRQMVAEGGAFRQMIDDLAAVRSALSPGAGWDEVTLSGGRVTGAGGVRLAPNPSPTVPAGARSDEAAEDARPSVLLPELGKWLGVAALASFAQIAAFAKAWAELGTGGSSWWFWFFLSAIFTAAATWALGTAGLRLAAGLRVRLLRGGIRADLEGVRRIGHSGLLGRIHEVDGFEDTAVAAALFGAYGISAVVVAGAVLVMAGHLVAVAMLVAVLGVIVVLHFVVANRRSVWIGERLSLGANLIERFRGHRTETIYGPSPSALQPPTEYGRKAGRLDAVRGVLLGGIDPLWLALGLATVSLGGPLVLGVGAILLAWDGVRSLVVASDQLATARTAWRNFRDLAAALRDLPAPPEAGPSGIGVSGVSVRYAGKSVSALADATVRINPGEHLLISGPSGSGKTTLASVLGGVRRPDQGRVSGVDRVVYVPQFGDNHVFQAPLMFNLLMGCEQPVSEDAWRAVDPMLVDLRLDGVVDRMPRGIGQPVGECGWQLSHGERTRLYLARALLQRPEVVLLDETLSGLDPRTTLAVLDLVMKRVPTVGIITHHDSAGPSLIHNIDTGEEEAMNTSTHLAAGRFNRG